MGSESPAGSTAPDSISSRKLAALASSTRSDVVMQPVGMSAPLPLRLEGGGPPVGCVCDHITTTGDRL